MAKKTLDELRVEIDELDIEIQSLIGARAQLASAVAKVKKSSEDQSVFYRPEREAQVLRKIIDRNDNLLKDKDMAHIFREIMSACLALEQPLNIAYLGPEGTFTQEAALKHFGHAVSTLDCGSIDEIFHQVEKGNAHYGVDRKSTRLNSSHVVSTYAVFCLKKNITGDAPPYGIHPLLV